MLIMPLSSALSKERFVNVKHSGYELVMDCITNTPVLFKFKLGIDTWNEKRSDDFGLDPKAPRSCQQTSARSYGKRKGTLYHRGHLVGANAMDGTKRNMEESFYMTNIVPQAERFNTGAWLLTEEYQECLREESNILVIGGLIYDDDKNDYFIRSHNIKTPDYFWKVIVTGEGYYAWIFPNTNGATKNNTKQYMTTIYNIESTIGFSLNLSSYGRNLPASTLPRNTRQCHLG